MKQIQASLWELNNLESFGILLMTSRQTTKENFAFQDPELYYPQSLGYATVTNNTKFPCHIKST